MRAICEGIGRASDATVTIDFNPNYPVTFNDPRETEFAGDVAAAVAGEPATHREIQPLMGGEDFSYMLRGEARRLHLHRQRRQRQPASRRLRLQRRSDSARGELLGKAGRNRARGMTGMRRNAVGETARSGYVSSRLVP